MLARVSAVTLLLFIALNFWPNCGFAKKVMQPKRFPVGCRQLGYSFQNNDLVLAPGTEESEQTLYFFHNVSNYPIHLEFQRDPEDVTSVKYETEIAANQWTAFAMDKKQMLFTCHFKADGNDEYTATSCQSVLEACQYNNAKFAEHNGGTYWVSQNKSLQEVLHESIRKVGILLRS